MGWRVARVCVFRKGRLSPAEIFVLLAALLTMFCQTLGGPMKDSCLPMGPIDLLQSLWAKMDPAGKGGGCSRETAHSFGETSVLHRVPAGKLLTFIFHTHTNDKNAVSIPYNLCPQCRGNFCTLCECLCIGGEKHNRGGSSGPPVFEYMVPLWARNPGATPAHLGHPVHPPHQGCPNLE